MKFPLIRLSWLLSSVALLGSGCSSLHSVQESLKSRFGRPQPQVHLVTGTQDAVFTAAREAMVQLGYQVGSGSRASGRLEGYTQVGAGEGFQGSYQRRIVVDFAPAGEDSMDVKVMIYEIRANSFGGPASTPTENPLRDSTAYDAFFAVLRGQLHAPAHR